MAGSLSAPGTIDRRTAACRGAVPRARDYPRVAILYAFGSLSCIQHPLLVAEHDVCGRMPVMLWRRGLRGYSKGCNDTAAAGVRMAFASLCGRAARYVSALARGGKSGGRSGDRRVLSLFACARHWRGPSRVHRPCMRPKRANAQTPAERCDLAR